MRNLAEVLTALEAFSLKHNSIHDHLELRNIASNALRTPMHKCLTRYKEKNIAEHNYSNITFELK